MAAMFCTRCLTMAAPKSKAMGSLLVSLWRLTMVTFVLLATGCGTNSAPAGGVTSGGAGGTSTGASGGSGSTSGASGGSGGTGGAADVPMYLHASVAVDTWYCNYTTAFVHVVNDGGWGSFQVQVWGSTVGLNPTWRDLGTIGPFNIDAGCELDASGQLSTGSGQYVSLIGHWQAAQSGPGATWADAGGSFAFRDQSLCSGCTNCP